jgi:stage IV sporulation protein B
MNTLSNRFTAVLLGLLVVCASFIPKAQAATRERESEGRCLIPVGHTVGVKLFSDGVLVVGLSEGCSPARESGIREGDVLVSFNGTDVTSTECLQRMLEENGSAQAALGIRRGAKTLTLQPAKANAVPLPNTKLSPCVCDIRVLRA